MTRRPITELSVDAAYRRLQSDRHQRFEAEMNSGAPIVDNAGHLTVIGQLEPDWATCPDCNGDCMITVTRERPGYLDEDVDVDCFTCDGTGRVQS